MHNTALMRLDYDASFLRDPARPPVLRELGFGFLPLGVFRPLSKEVLNDVYFKIQEPVQYYFVDYATHPHLSIHLWREND